MKQHLHTPRAAIALLLAGVAFPISAAAQETPPPTVNAPPPPTVNAPPPRLSDPAPTVTAPPPTVTAPSPFTPPPQPLETAPEPAGTPRAATTRRAPAAARAAPAPTRTRAPARPAAEAAPAPAAETPAPTAAPLEAPAAPPPAAAPAPVPFPPVAADAAPAEAGMTDMTWPLLIGAAAILVVAGLWWALRRRRTGDEHESVYVDEDHVAPAAEPASEPGFVRSAALAGAAVPLAAAAPFAPPAHDVVAERPASASAEPATAADRVSIGEPAAADVEALAAASEAPADRPWLEFLMRPVRAGTTGDDAVVEFELTVGNTGAVAARDVRISTWMFAAGSAAETEMERMLIEPPAEAQVSETDLAPGDGTRVEAALALPRSQLAGAVLPVVVADARYTLPDGSEGRTSASFEVGLPDEAGLAPFPTDRASGLLETVEARLHGDLERA